VPESTGEKYRHCDILIVTPADGDTIRAHGKLTDVKILVPKGSEEHLLWRQQLTDRVYAINLYSPVYNGTGAVIITKGCREREDTHSAASA